MRDIPVKKITDTVARLCQQANFFLPEDVVRSLEQGYLRETSESGRAVFGEILQNAKIAAGRSLPLCQDTGITDIFITLGQDAHVSGGSLLDAVNKGVEEGYTKGYLRKSVVKDPLERVNTGTNAPAQVSVDIVPGDRLEITILPKGGGSENASALKMLTPSAGWQGIKDFILEVVKEKGINACPPLIIGVGIGGDFSSVARLAKKALLRETGAASPLDLYAERERELLRLVNETGIGPMGLGGITTALAVHIEPAACHIASLPVAVSMQCHSCRKIKEIL